MELTEFVNLAILGKLVGTLLFSLPMAINREKADNSGGLRTFSIVAVTSCGFMLVGSEFLGEVEATSRLMQGLIGGLGFLGGGAILKREGDVKGMATAASIWCAGAIGMAVAFDQWEIGIFLSLMNWSMLSLGQKAKAAISDSEHDS